MTRRSRILLFSLAALLAVMAATVLSLGYSESLVRSVVTQLPQRFGGVLHLEVRGVSGSLAGGLRVQSIDIEIDTARIRIRDLETELVPWPLFWQEVRLGRLRASSVDIDVLPRDLPIPETPLRFLPALLAIDSKSTRVERLTINPIAGLPIVFAPVEFDTVVRARTLRIRSSRVAIEPGALALVAEGVIRAARPLVIDADVQAIFTPKRGPIWRLAGRLDGDLESLGVEATLTEPFSARIAAGTLRALPPWRFSGQTQIDDLDLTRFGGSAALGPLSGLLTLDIDREGYRARGQLLPPALAAGEFGIRANARYARGVVALSELALTHESGLIAGVSGNVIFADAGPALDLRIDYTGLRWPLDPRRTSVLESTEGALRLMGETPYRLDGQLRLQLAALPVIGVETRSRLIRGGMDFEQLDIRGLGGSAAMRGELRWTDGLSWQLSGNARGIDPREIRPAVSGALDFDFRLRGRGVGSQSVLDIDWRNLRGLLRGTPARGQGGITLAGSGWQFRKIDLAAGGLKLALDGTLTPQRRDLRFRIDADDLGVLARDGRGRIRATGHLRGTPNALQLGLQASGSGIALAGVAIGTLEADIDLDPLAGPTAPVKALVRAQKLEGFGRDAQGLAFVIEGTVADHALRLDVDSRELGIAARGKGRFLDSGWSQSWERFDLDLVEDFRLGLSSPLNVALNASGLSLERFCLRGRDAGGITKAATLCAAYSSRTEGWTGQIDIERLPLAALLPAPSSRVSYDGIVNASASVRSSPAGLPLGSLRVDFTDARLRWMRANGREDVIPFGAGSARVDSTTDGLTGELTVAAAERGRARGELVATRDVDGALDWRAMPLRASLRADSSALALLYLYVPEIDRSAGDLSADLVLGGTLGAPLVNGVLRLENGELDFYQINLALRGIDAEARLLDNRFTLKSAARAGEGTIAANAELLWRSGLPYGSLSIQGERLRIIDLPEAQILASPDLRFDVDGRRLRASGSVVIPSARITPIDLTGARVSSRDEIRVDQDVRDSSGTFLVSSNLRLSLGERVSVESFGLTGRLGGTLNLISNTDGTTRATGELSIADGKYAAFGRLLDIERGRLLFGGGLINDPGIDVRATKVFPEVKAGVNVRGTLREPRMSFFSEPSLPQSQIVSLVLAGGTGEVGVTGASNAAVGRNALLAQGSALLAQQLGQRLGQRIGIEDIGIEQNLANETSLVFGRYLSSRLYISYGISLAEAINTIKMRYSINDRWTLRTEAGQESSADIVYTVEKN